MEPSESGRDERGASDPHRPHRMAIALLLACVLLVAGATIAAVRYYGYCASGGDTHATVRFTVTQGESGEDVVRRLASAGVTHCGGLAGRLLLQRSGRAAEIRAGTYVLATNMTFDQVIARLTAAPTPVPTVDVTIPEGYDLSQIADRVERDLGIPATQFLHLVRGGGIALPPYLPASAPTPEGFLFPATYEFVRGGTAPGEVVRKMLSAFSSEASDLHLTQGAARLGLSPYQVVTVASMIEKEAKIERDRPLIAAVIYNRLKRGMTLGIDATLLYDDPTPDGRLSESDLRSPSPYNTRIHAGLPPTPIASPGAASLRAALSPAHVDYLYYVLCGADGHHVFSDSYGQFLRDKARCLG